MIAIEQIARSGALDRGRIERLAITRQPDDEGDLRVVRADRGGLRGFRSDIGLRCCHRGDEGAHQE